MMKNVVTDEGSPRRGATSSHEKRSVRYRIGGAGVQEGSGSVWCYEPVDEGDLRRAEHKRVCHEHEGETSIERAPGRPSHVDML